MSLREATKANRIKGVKPPEKGRANQSEGADVSESWWAVGGEVFRHIRAGRFEATQSMLIPKGTELRSRADLKAFWEQRELRGDTALTTDGSTGEQINIVDLFCGCGGLSAGFRRAAHASGVSVRHLLAADKKADALSVYKRNFSPELAFNGNLFEVVDFQYEEGDSAKFLYEPELIEPSFSRWIGQVDVLLAGPPCEGNSNVNNKTRRDDPRNHLYLMPVAIGVALRARVIVIENVPEVKRDKRGVVQTAKNLLCSMGYQVDDINISGVALGLPQTRKRNFLLAARGGRPPNLKTAFDALRVSDSRSISWAIHDLLDIKGTTIFDTHSELSEDNLRRIKYLFEHDVYDLPNPQRPVCHHGDHSYPSVYGRLHWEEPAGTITTGFLSPGRGRFVHPLRPRTLTPHEAARLQGFPDGFRFDFDHGGLEPQRTRLATWIGDAVPIPMGYLVGLAAIATL